ncbi:MAG: hypothetical protein CR217_16635 [Beijerinckiaceae bacterium]|nr:MAG: hypothetical protein CR217_16635 [Beijerinckiaceae bacterium]
MMTKISYSGYRFPSEIIQRAIWLYVRFTFPALIRKSAAALAQVEANRLQITGASAIIREDALKFWKAGREGCVHV